MVGNLVQFVYFFYYSTIFGTEFSIFVTYALASVSSYPLEQPPYKATLIKIYISPTSYLKGEIPGLPSPSSPLLFLPTSGNSSIWIVHWTWLCRSGWSPHPSPLEFVLRFCFICYFHFAELIEMVTSTIKEYLHICYKMHSGAGPHFPGSLAAPTVLHSYVIETNFWPGEPNRLIGF